MLLSGAALPGFAAPVSAFDSLPLRFEKNLGQAPAAAAFLAHGRGYQFLLFPDRTRISLAAPGGRSSTVVSRLAGANFTRPVAGSPTQTRTNYFRGASANAWLRDVPSYVTIRYPRVYPGTDLLFHGEAGRLEYDFLLAPFASAAPITLTFDGARALHINSFGDLVVSTPAGDILWRKPVAYQNLDGIRRAVAARFSVHGLQARFALGPYDHSAPLVIDPTLAFATFLGGAGNEEARAVAVDPSGNIYVAGATDSSNFPVTSKAFQRTYGGDTGAYLDGDAFVAKLDPTGATALYVTYLGGAGDDLAYSIAVDSTGSAYVTGNTSSSDFPTTTGAFSQKFAGSGGNTLHPGGDVFVTKLSPTGDALTYSTYIGGPMDDRGAAIVLDSQNDAYIAGATMSPTFPLGPGKPLNPAGYQGAGGSPNFANFSPLIQTGDAFVVKLDPTGAHLLAGTMIGGTLDDAALAIALDHGGNVLIAGATMSKNFPVKNAFQPTFGGTNSKNEVFVETGDAFLAKLDPGLTTLSFSTYLGGSGDDAALALAVDAAGNSYITGFTASPNFPVSPGAFSTTYHGPTSLIGTRPSLFGDAFAAKFDPSGQRIFSTYLGGNDDDIGNGIAVDGAGNIYIGGLTNSADFPVASAIISKFAGTAGGFHPISHGFVTEMSADGKTLPFSTYLGGSSVDAVGGLALDSAGNIYVTGATSSPDFPVTSNALQHTYGGGNPNTFAIIGDAFLAKIANSTSPTPTVAAVVNGASFQPGAVSPGEIVSIFGSNLGPAQGQGAIFDPASGRLTTTNGNVQVMIGGTAAPLAFVRDNQVNAIVPYLVNGSQTAQLQVTYNAATSAPFALNVAASAPGIFSQDSSGKGPGVVFNQDGTLNTASNPAAPGTIIQIFGTGEGQTSPAGQDGLRALSPPYPTPLLPVSVQVGNVTLTEIDYKGAIPTFVAGLFQVNARLTSNVPSGTQPLVVTVGTANTQSGLTVFIK